MSTHAASEAEASAHDHAVFDGEAATTVPADEPRTPGWLPALGGVLFVVVAVWFLAISKDEPQPATAASAAPVAAEPAAPSPQPAPHPSSRPIPIATADGVKIPEPPASGRKFTPEEAARVRDMLEQMKKGKKPMPLKK